MKSYWRKIQVNQRTVKPTIKQIEQDGGLIVGVKHSDVRYRRNGRGHVTTLVTIKFFPGYVVALLQEANPQIKLTRPKPKRKQIWNKPAPFYPASSPTTHLHRR